MEAGVPVRRDWNGDFRAAAFVCPKSFIVFASLGAGCRISLRVSDESNPTETEAPLQVIGCQRMKFETVDGCN
ncbi:MAG: hypothetical protein ACLQPN_02750 [Bryobacteraceae bacterium]